MTIELNASLMTDRKTAHEYLQHQLRLPAYYGKNLDALYDLLTERGEETHIRVSESAKAEELLGNYGALLISSLTEAAENNPALTVELL